ncbi:MAG: hypothetical protein K2O15_11580 [Lachnospiraceae bacterium]|nr:hypothetical protein [Lachnospiraceae bacterium]
MRKYNSSFKTAFISEEGSRLKNNDYFGFVELDKYACYVIADGITDMRDSESAKRAIEAVISAFHNEPGISRGKLKRYLKYANKELLKGKSYEKLKASITVVLTDYVKFRYGYAGNTRLRLYRDGRMILASSDMSLSQDMVEADRLPEDKLAKHEERNNLYCYLGRKHFKPAISKKMKLADGDIITLYTRGIWENIDEGELSDVFAETGNEPIEECDKVEDLLLSRQPENLDNYTFAAIYIDKVFTDPNRKKRIKKIITITLIILILALVVSVLVWLWRRDRRQKREDMEQCLANVETYIEDNNYVRAKQECEKALELAGKLRDQEAEERYNNYLVCLEAVIQADDAYDQGKYEEAGEAYLSAMVRARYADNIATVYIEDRLQRIENFEQVFNNITMGDSLLAYGSYEMAEQRYLEAKKDASAIYFTEGKQQALDALEKLYEEWSAAEEEAQEQSEAQAADEAAAAELVRQGDEAYSSGDYDGAMVFYLIALEKYTKMEDTTQIAFLNKKIVALNEKQQEVEARVSEAKEFEELARVYEEEGDYEQAKLQYQYAKNIYGELNQSNKADEIQSKVDIMETKKETAEKKAEEEAKEAEKEAAEKEAEENAARSMSENNLYDR